MENIANKFIVNYMLIISTYRKFSLSVGSCSVNVQYEGYFNYFLITLYFNMHIYKKLFNGSLIYTFTLNILSCVVRVKTLKSLHWKENSIDTFAATS